MLRRAITILGLNLIAAGCGEAGSEAEPVVSEAGAAVVEAPSATAAAPAVQTTAAPSAAPVAASANIPDRLEAIGTEPFWNVAVHGNKLRYSTPENQAGEATTAVLHEAASARIFTGKVSGKAFAMTITAAKCSDGMSDTEYPFSVTLSVAGENRQGCARRP